jgi:hypothetical protein
LSGRPSGDERRDIIFEKEKFKEEPIMRAPHVIIAAVAVILIGVGVKLIFFSAPTAEANLLSVKSVSMDVSEVQRNTKNLPVQKRAASMPWHDIVQSIINDQR